MSLNVSPLRLALPPMLLAGGFGIWLGTGSIVPVVLALATLQCLGMRYALLWTAVLLASALPTAAAWSATPAHDILSVSAALGLGIAVHAMRAAWAPWHVRAAHAQGGELAEVQRALAAAAHEGRPLALVLCETQRRNRTMPEHGATEAPALAPLVRVDDGCRGRPDGRTLLILTGVSRRGVNSLLQRLKPLRLRAGVALCDVPQPEEARALIAQAEDALQGARRARRTVMFAGQGG